MAKKGMIERDKKRAQMVKKFAAKRAELKAILSNPDTPDEEFYEAQRKLTKLPKNSSPIRVRNRCRVTGRPRAFIRKRQPDHVPRTCLAGEDPRRDEVLVVINPAKKRKQHV